MSRDMQIFLCIVPYLFALVIGFSYIPQGWDESNRINSELTTMKGEYQKLADKLSEKEKLLGEHAKLDKDIQKVRSAVPPTAEMDILLMDLERISEQCKCDLLGVEPPSADKSNEKKGSLMDSIIAEMGGKGPDKKRDEKVQPQGLAPPVISNQPGKPPVSAKSNLEEQDNLGIQRIERRVFVAGDYKQLVAFLKKLESYRRIVGIQDLQIAAPPGADTESSKTVAGDKATSLELKKPVMTFLMNVYFLPGTARPPRMP